MFVSRLSIMMALNTRESRVVSGCDSFNSLNPPPAENFVTPQNGNLHSGRTTIHLVPEAACSAINWRAKTRLPQRHTRFSRP